jgi:hypothetical protein
LVRTSIFQVLDGHFLGGAVDADNLYMCALVWIDVARGFYAVFGWGMQYFYGKKAQP